VTLGTIQTGAFHHTWVTAILPYIDQAPMYNRINFLLPAEGQPHVRLQVPMLLCPSSPTLGGADATHGYSITNYAAAEGFELNRDNYLWNDHSTETTLTNSYGARLFSGIFTIERSPRMADILDGTSTTVAVAEVTSVGHKNGGRHGEFGGTLRQGPGEAVYRAAFVSCPYWGEGADPAKYVRPDGSPQVYGQWYKEAPFHMHPTFITHNHINAEYWGADSAHPGIAHVLFADGSARPLGDTMDYGVWVIVNGYSDQIPTGEL
jgi:hypothetical protein